MTTQEFGNEDKGSAPGRDSDFDQIWSQIESIFYLKFNGGSVCGAQIVGMGNKLKIFLAVKLAGKYK